MKCKLVLTYGTSSRFDYYKEIPSPINEDIRLDGYTIVFDEELSEVLDNISHYDTVLNTKDNWNDFVKYMKQEKNKIFLVRINSNTVSNVLSRLKELQLINDVDLKEHLLCIYSKENIQDALFFNNI